jgi:hypothetical protein
MIWDLTPYSFVGRCLSGEKKSIGGRTLENQSRNNGIQKKAEERRP